MNWKYYTYNITKLSFRFRASLLKQKETCFLNLQDICKVVQIKVKLYKL